MKNISEKTLLVILIVLVSFFGIFQADKAANRISQLSNQVNNLSSDVNRQSRQLSDLYTQIEDLLKKQGSILDSYEITYGAFDSGNMTYEVSIKATPKETWENTAADVALGGVRGEMSRSGTSFSGVVHVPLTEEASPTVTFYEGGKSRSETLDDIVSFRAHYLYQIKSGFSGEKSHRDGKLSYNGDIFLYFDSPEGFSLKSGRLFATLNDKEVFTKEISLDSPKENTFPFNEAFPINPGDRFALFVEIRDESGLTYRYPVDSAAVSSDGRALSEHYLPDECAVYDKNGKEITFE